jgi:YfiH family protein
MPSAPTVTNGLNAAGVVRIDAWAQFPWLYAGFSTRQGGGSTAYAVGGPGDLNLGWTAEDDAAIVAENRRQFARSVCGSSQHWPELVTIRQTHSDVVRVVEREAAPLVTPDGRAILEGDGLMTREAGLLLGVQTADCVPVLVADPRTRAVAAFHAGWRGTLARIVEHGVGAMGLQFGSRPEDLIAAIGPSIGPCCFAVGEEVRADFEGRFGYAAGLFRGQPLRMDLWEANRRQLLDAGLRPEAITVVGECTACRRLADGRRKYFSHRAEKGFTGRMLSVVGVRE